MYDPQMVAPMRAELTTHGVRELTTAADVDAAFAETKGTHLLMVNSVCGCAAGSARPGLIQSLAHGLRPDRVTTVFAGVDKEATARAREFIEGYPPSSPAMALFRDGVLVHMIERHDIEGVDGESLGKMITKVYDKYCGEKIDESIRIVSPMDELEIEPVAFGAAMKAATKPAVLDCRDDFEKERSDLPFESPLLSQELAEEIVSNWPKDRPIVIFCHHGQRSFQAVRFFRQYGFTEVKSLRGGIDAYAREVDSSIPRYV